MTYTGELAVDGATYQRIVTGQLRPMIIRYRLFGGTALVLGIWLGFLGRYTWSAICFAAALGMLLVPVYVRWRGNQVWLQHPDASWKYTVSEQKVRIVSPFGVNEWPWTGLAVFSTAGEFWTLRVLSDNSRILVPKAAFGGRKGVDQLISEKRKP